MQRDAIRQQSLKPLQIEWADEQDNPCLRIPCTRTPATSIHAEPAHTPFAPSRVPLIRRQGQPGAGELYDLHGHTQPVGYQSAQAIGRPRAQCEQPCIVQQRLRSRRQPLTEMRRAKAGERQQYLRYLIRPRVLA